MVLLKSDTKLSSSYLHFKLFFHNFHHPKRLLSIVKKFNHAEIECIRNTLYICKIRETLIETRAISTYFIRERNSTNLP